LTIRANAGPVAVTDKGFRLVIVGTDGPTIRGNAPVMPPLVTEYDPGGKFPRLTDNFGAGKIITWQFTPNGVTEKVMPMFVLTIATLTEFRVD
jgi:hypothetical protein